MTHARIGAQGAQRLITHEGYVYLDVRTELEFELGHPSGAYNVPWQRRDHERALRDNPDFLRVVRASFAPDTKLIVGCRSGKHSLRAGERLVAAGFSRVVEQRAGYAGKRDAFGAYVDEGWERCGLPTRTEAEPGRDYASLLARAAR